MRAIYKRELDSYFHSMIGYVFIAFFLAFTGVYFMAYNLTYGYPVFSYVLSSLVFILMLSIPVLTMKSFFRGPQKQNRSASIDSSCVPGTDRNGKISGYGNCFPYSQHCVLPFSSRHLKYREMPIFWLDYSGILTSFLLGCVFISIGMFLSSLTESQIIAALSSIGVLLILYLWDGLIGFLPSSALLNLFILIVIFTLVCALSGILPTIIFWAVFWKWSRLLRVSFPMWQIPAFLKISFRIFSDAWILRPLWQMLYQISFLTQMGLFCIFPSSDCLFFWRCSPYKKDAGVRRSISLWVKSKICFLLFHPGRQLQPCNDCRCHRDCCFY